MKLALDGLVEPGRTSTYVVLPSAKLASATKRPMKPVAPMMSVGFCWAIL